MLVKLTCASAKSRRNFSSSASLATARVAACAAAPAAAASSAAPAPEQSPSSFCRFARADSNACGDGGRVSVGAAWSVPRDARGRRAGGPDRAAGRRCKVYLPF